MKLINKIIAKIKKTANLNFLVLMISPLRKIN